MSGFYRSKGAQWEALADGPLTGPTPNHQISSFPTGTGSGHQPGRVPLTVTSTAITSSTVIPIAVPVSPNNVISGTYPLTPSGLPAENATNKLPIVGIVNTSGIVQLTGTTVFGLQGQVVLTLLMTNSSKAYTAPSYSTIAISVTDNIGAVYIYSFVIPNQLGLAGTQYQTVSAPFTLPYNTSRSSVSFQITGSFTDGSTAVMTVVGAANYESAIYIYN